MAQIAPVAKTIYSLGRQAGLPDNRARELVAAAYAESSLNPQATNKSSGAAGVFQLLSSGYRQRAQQLGGLYDVAANTRAILPNYLTYWRQHPAAAPGEGASSVEASGEGSGFYARPLATVNPLLPGGGGAAVPAPAATPRPSSSVSQGDWTTALAGRSSADWVGALSGRAAAPSPTAPAASWVDALSGQPRARARVTPTTAAAAPSAPMPAGGYPLAKPGKIIGVPYKGTHTLYGNWESDNAVDVATPAGTPVVALTDGTIGPQIGPLNASGDPRLEGLRVHLVAPGNEYYYAHLSRLTVKAGQKVKAGQIIGYSGSANGVQHLHFAEKNGNPLQTVGA